MTTTPLGFTHLTNNPNQPEDPVNAMVDGVENSIHAWETHSISGNKTLSDAEFTENFRHVLNAEAGSPNVVADWTLTVPAFTKTFQVENNTGYACTVASAGAGTSVVLQDGEAAILTTDATNVALVAKLSLRMVFFFPGKPGDGELLVEFPAWEPFTILATAPGSRGYARTPPTFDATYSLKRNDVEFGTMVFGGSPTSNDAWFVVASDQAFVLGDRLQIEAPAFSEVAGSPVEQDPTLSDVSMVLIARSS